MNKRTTVSVIKADVGGYVGHSSVHEDLIGEAKWHLETARAEGFVLDFHIAACGDTLQLILTHRRGEKDEEIHHTACRVFQSCAQVAGKLKLHEAGQDLLADAFSGDIKDIGAGVAEMAFEERSSEPIIVFMSDKTTAGAWNLPLCRMFADPFNTAGLVLSPRLQAGFRFEVHDMEADRRSTFETPEETYDLMGFAGAASRYMIRRVYSKAGEIGAVSSTHKPAQTAAEYSRGADPVCIVRCEDGFPTVGEVLEPFTTPYLVAGWLRRSHYGPLLPVELAAAHPSRFDGPPRVVALGFQLAYGRLIGPRDMFDDPSFDSARSLSNSIADYLRGHGPFEPHCVPFSDPVTLEVARKLEERWEELTS
jgi:fructose 1,6-bisphosphate aldolase/phosphatase